MELPLYRHLKNYIDSDQEELNKILSYFKLKTIHKKEDVLKIGQKCNNMFFVQKGCLYLYALDENGTEKTIQFAIENWWLSDVLAFRSQSGSQFGIKAALTSEVMELSFPDYSDLLESHPNMEKYFKTVNEIAHGAAQMRIKFLFTHSKEEIYHHFNDRFPEFVNRVPQYLLATYLNLTPEYLSQIRKKSIS